jgi:hypothetical protein
VTQQQLDLLQLPAGRATQFRAGATTVVRGDSRYSGGQRVRLEQLPDDLLAQAGTLGLAGAVYGSEYVSVRNPGRRRPRIDCHLYPCRHRHRPDAAVLSNQIYDAPPPVALLDVGDGERSHLRAPEPAAQEDRQDRAIPEPLGRGGVRRVQERLRLPHRQPVPQADPLGCDTLHPRNPIGEFGRQQPVVRSLDRQLADRRDPHVDGNGAKPAGLQCNAPGGDGRFGKAGPRLYTRRVIGDETLSSTKRFSLCQWAACGTTIKSVI